MSAHLHASRVVFVLGAGASVPLGMPTTKSLREALCNDTEEGRIAAEIHRSAAYRFRVPEDSINIEDFLEHVYELQLLLWLARRSSLPNLLPKLTSNSRALTRKAETLEGVQRRTLELLHGTCGDCSGRRVDTLWRPVLEHVAERQPVVPIFTLNYDWTFEKLAIEKSNRYQVADGFELLGGTWDPARFAERPSRNRIDIRLFKLHGSTSWLPGGPVKSMGSFVSDAAFDDDRPTRQFEMVYPGHRHELLLGKEYWQRLNEPAGMFGTWIEREPYQTLHGYLHEAVQHARLIVVIGYAFHDEVVNSEITEAVSANKRTKILVVDPGIQRYVKRTDSTHQDPPFEWLKFNASDTDWSRFYWLQGCFGRRRTTRELVDAISELSPPRRRGT